MRYEHRSRAFFVEFIVISFFFICIAAVIIFVLSESVQRSRQNEEVMRALLESKNIHALIISSRDYEELKKNLIDYGCQVQQQGEEQIYKVYYNKEWEIQSELIPEGYEVEIQLVKVTQGAGVWLKSTLEFTQQNEVDNIYQAQLDKYYQAKVEG